MKFYGFEYRTIDISVNKPYSIQKFKLIVGLGKFNSCMNILNFGNNQKKFIISYFHFEYVRLRLCNSLLFIKNDEIETRKKNVIKNGKIFYKA